MHNTFKEYFTRNIAFQYLNNVQVYKILLSSEIKAECHSIQNQLHLPHEQRLKFEQCENL